MAFAIQLVVAAVVVLAFAGLLLRWPTDRHVGLFADTYCVPVTAANHRVLALYIWWSRAWRFGGGAIGLIGGAIIGRVTEVDAGDSWPVLIALGYGVGAAIGELVRPRPRSLGGRRQAALERRGVGSYVHTWVGWAIATMSVASIVSLLMYVDIADDHSVERVRWGLADSASVVAATVAALIAAALAMLVARRTARRPQPAEPAQFEAVHHAIRSAAIMSLLGAALMLVGLATINTASQTALIDTDQSEAVRWIHNTLAFTAFVAFVAGFLLSIRSIPRFGSPWRRVPVVVMPAEPR
jgi:hypothetical protein